MTAEYVGFNDVPAEDDLVSVEQYLDGLAGFIEKCQTPMTIAVQGDWGTGKTSAMGALQRRLSSRDYWQVTFNTWQYSQFDLGEQLVFSLFGTILNDLQEKLEKTGGDGESFNQTASRLIKAASKALYVFAKTVVRGSAKELLPLGGEVVEGYDAAKGEYKKTRDALKTEGVEVAEDPSVSLVSDLRQNMEAIVAEIVKPKNSNEAYIPPKRIVVYIDDLDRLEPEKAVVLMEAIKIFLDVPHCVFVLAIDFGVVLRGIRAKYGDDLSEDKARAFFDKIIQVPFNLPVGAYDVSKLLEAGLKSFGVEPNQEFSKKYIELVENSVGRNPRSVKRLINTFGLIKNISHRITKTPDGEDIKKYVAKDIHIFAVLCLQTAYPNSFEELTRPRSIEGRLKQWNDIVLVTEEDNESVQDIYEKYGISTYQQESFNRFVELLAGLFTQQEKGGLNEDLFNDALAMSAVTAVGTTEATGGQSGSFQRKSPIESFDSRIAKLEAKRTKEVVAIATAFEHELRECLNGVEAGVTGEYWSYEAVEGSRLTGPKVGQRFLELYWAQQKIRLEFGKWLSQERAQEIIDTIKAKFKGPKGHYNANNTPPCSVTEICTEEQARFLAKLIAQAYIDEWDQL